MYYPRWVFSPREDVTRENMRKYEKRLDEYHKEKAKIETELKRKLTLTERVELSKKFDI